MLSRDVSGSQLVLEDVASAAVHVDPRDLQHRRAVAVVAVDERDLAVRALPTQTHAALSSLKTIAQRTSKVSRSRLSSIVIHHSRGTRSIYGHESLAESLAT